MVGYLKLWYVCSDCGPKVTVGRAEGCNLERGRVGHAY